MRAHGKRRADDEGGLDEVFDRSRGAPDGTYRVIAGRALPGRPVGGFRYFGTGRTIRTTSCRTSTAASCAPCRCSARGPTSSDMKAGNTLDTVDHRKRPQRRPALPAGRRIDVRHRRQRPRDGDEGYEYCTRGCARQAASSRFGFISEPLADGRLRRDTKRLAGSKGTIRARNWTPRVPWLRFGMPVPTTSSGRRCG